MRYSTIYEKVGELPGGYKFVTLKSGRRVMFTDARGRAEAALTTLYTWTARMGKLARDYANTKDWFGDDLSEYDFDWEEIERHVDHVEEFVQYWRAKIKEHQVRRNTQLRILALRNVSGRGPKEAAAFLAKADQLERKLADG